MRLTEPHNRTHFKRIRHYRTLCLHSSNFLIMAGLSSWQVISPVEVVGYVVSVDELLAVQNEAYERPTILVAKSVKGQEEIPDGTVAVLTPDMPDVLSHVSVRARNSKVSLFFFLLV